MNGLGGWKESADEPEGEQNYSEAQETESEGQTDSNIGNDIDAEKVTDANTNDSAGDDDANFFVKLFDKLFRV